MNLKLIVVGGLVFYVVMLLLSFVTGPLIHEGILDPAYQANETFWQPALRQDPPDMGALMPRWIIGGLTTAFIMAGIYGWIRGGLSGAPWLKGVKYGVILSLFGTCLIIGWSGVFYLPNQIWIWWALEQPIYYLIGGAALGWVAQKMAPEDQA